MRKILTTLTLAAAALGITGCTPAQIDAVLHPAAKLTTSHPTVPAPIDYILRWQCPSGSYDSKGHQIYFWVNTAGYLDMSPADRATCFPIKPVDMSK